MLARSLDDRNDPLLDLLGYHEHAPLAGYQEGVSHQDLLKWFCGLEDVLRTPFGKKINWHDAGSIPGPASLSSTELTRARRLFGQVVNLPGYGRSEIEGSLLSTIALNDNPSSVPFWAGLLDLRIGRDSLSKRRKRFALAALAFSAIVSGAEEAWIALAAATRHSNLDVRTDATYFVGELCLRTDGPVTSEGPAVLAERARSDRSFGPRFLARLLLRELGRPISFDKADSVVTLQVSHIYHQDVLRLIEVVQANTLDDLHFAIQDAFGWGADHLYSFFLSNRPHDFRFTFDCDDIESEHRSTSCVPIGDLGLKRGQRITYFFDYGDNHEFEVVVKAVKDQREEREYPRILESAGKAPDQYPGSDHQHKNVDS